MSLSEVPGSSVLVLYLSGEVGGKPAPLEVPQSLSLIPTWGTQKKVAILSLDNFTECSRLMLQIYEAIWELP